MTSNNYLSILLDLEYQYQQIIDESIFVSDVQSGSVVELAEQIDIKPTPFHGVEDLANQINLQ